jgi:hypothetical protein
MGETLPKKAQTPAEGISLAFDPDDAAIAAASPCHAS